MSQPRLVLLLVTVLGALLILLGEGAGGWPLKGFTLKLKSGNPKHGDFQCENLIPHHFLGNFRLVFVAVDSQYMESRRNEGLPPSAKVFLLPKMGHDCISLGYGIVDPCGSANQVTCHGGCACPGSSRWIWPTSRDLPHELFHRWKCAKST